MWVVIVGVVPLIIEWANLKYEMSSREKQEKFARGFAWAGFSVIFYLIILTSGYVTELKATLGALGSVLLAKWVSTKVCDISIKINAPDSAEEFAEGCAASVKIFVTSFILLVIALIFNLLV